MRRGRRSIRAAAAVAAAGVAMLTATGSATAASGPVAETTIGRLHGITTHGVREFRGVRYARAPVGRLRWAPPVPVARSRTESVAADRYGASCPQTGGPGVSGASRTEDCLFLNVTTPRHVSRGARLPVMFWIHGGGYTSGAGSAYDARRLAAEGHVVVVTVNYRLGIFGYLGLPGMRGGGDFGLLDAVTALRFTARNAAAFGGDPHNVTVFGQSAGGMESCALLTSPAARGLVDKVASQSGGSCMLNWPDGALVYKAPAQTPYMSARVNRALSAGVARRLGCHGPRTLACLRRLPARRLLPATVAFGNALAYGTALLPQDPATAIRRGRFLHVPVLTGGTRNEEFSFVAGGQRAIPSAYTPGSYPKLLATAFGPAAAQVAAHYPLSAYPSAGAAFARLVTDDSWSCATLLGDRLIARGGAPVYAYEFDDPASPNVNGLRVAGIPQDSAHATDLPYLFDLGGRDLLRTAASRRLSRAEIAYWSSFARTGRPTAPGEPPWPRFDPSGTRVQGLDATGIVPVDVSAEHQCDLWQSINPQDR